MTVIARQVVRGTASSRRSHRHPAHHDGTDARGSHPECDGRLFYPFDEDFTHQRHRHRHDGQRGERHANRPGSLFLFACSAAANNIRDLWPDIIDRRLSVREANIVAAQPMSRRIASVGDLSVRPIRESARRTIVQGRDDESVCFTPPAIWSHGWPPQELSAPRSLPLSASRFRRAHAVFIDSWGQRVSGPQRPKERVVDVQGNPTLSSPVCVAGESDNAVSMAAPFRPGCPRRLQAVAPAASRVDHGYRRTCKRSRRGFARTSGFARGMTDLSADSRPSDPSWWLMAVVAVALTFGNAVARAQETSAGEAQETPQAPQTLTRADELDRAGVRSRPPCGPSEKIRSSAKANRLLDRGLVEGIRSGLGNNGWQLLFTGTRPAQGQTFGIGYRRSDLFNDALTARATVRGTLAGALLVDGETAVNRLRRSADTFVNALYEVRAIAADGLLRPRTRFEKGGPDPVSAGDVVR